MRMRTLAGDSWLFNWILGDVSTLALSRHISTRHIYTIQAATTRIEGRQFMRFIHWNFSTDVSEQIVRQQSRIDTCMLCWRIGEHQISPCGHMILLNSVEHRCCAVSTAGCPFVDARVLHDEIILSCNLRVLRVSLMLIPRHSLPEPQPFTTLELELDLTRSSCSCSLNNRTTWYTVNSSRHSFDTSFSIQSRIPFAWDATKENA